MNIHVHVVKIGKVVFTINCTKLADLHHNLNNKAESALILAGCLCTVQCTSVHLPPLSLHHCSIVALQGSNRTGDIGTTPQEHSVLLTVQCRYQQHGNTKSHRLKEGDREKGKVVLSTVSSGQIKPHIVLGPPDRL